MRAPFTQLYLHCLWATWDRQPLVTAQIEQPVYAFILAKTRELAAVPIAILSTIGWMISWLAMALIPLVDTTTCTQGSTDAWLVSLLLYTPIALVGLVLLYFGRDNSRSTRWLAIPHAVLVPLAVVTAIRYLWRCTIVGDHLCTIATREVSFASEPRQWWNPLWAPVQLALVAGICAMIWLYWRVASTAGSPANPPLDRAAGTNGAARMESLRDARGRSAPRS